MQKRAKIGEAIARKYPEQVVLVTTRSRTGRPNVMAVGWVSIASGDPMMFVLGIDDEALTYRLIRQTKEFVVAFPNEGMGSQTVFVGTRHGHDVDKLTDCGLETQDGVAVKAPLVADAVANFECRLVKIIRPGDCPLIVGQVVAAHVNKRMSMRRLYTVGKGYKMAGVRPAMRRTSKA
jgi:flavin reductase (DIM6/NTAB) family NADH-FMN oxidoreductase RutF